MTEAQMTIQAASIVMNKLKKDMNDSANTI